MPTAEKPEPREIAIQQRIYQKARKCLYNLLETRPIVQKRPMAKDHFVAQTYLKRWCNPEKRPPLQVYRKSNAGPFRCSPRDVCHEWDGDLNPTYFDNPAVLGDFRKIFEPKWRPTVERLSAGKADKYVLSMAWAHFFLCTPAQREIVKGILANEIQAMAPSLVEGHRLDPASLNIEIEREPDFLKRFGTKHLARATGVFYNQDWIILINETETPFITSDNPSAFFPESKPPERVLPISPSLCLYAKIDMSFADEGHFDLGSPPKPEGSITFRNISRSGAMKINCCIAINANEWVFSRSEDVGVAALVKKYRDVRPQVEPVSFPADDGALKGATFIIEPRTK